MTNPRCRNCGFNLARHDDRSAMPGRCDQCGQRVCFGCGCTNDEPCERPRVDGPAVCSWQTLVIMEMPDGRPALGMADLVPGMCSFCFERIAKEAYEVITSKVCLA